MRLVLTGATGLIGHRLITDRLARGDDLVVISRDAGRARRVVPDAVEVVEGDPNEPGDWQRSVDGSDAIVHLAGASVAGRRWTPSWKQTILDSRVDSTHQVVEACRAASTPPKVLVSTSAVGIYPEGGDTPITEATPADPSHFLGAVVVAWEAAAAPARDLGIRVVHPRIGIVLDDEGGALGTLARIVRLGIGGPVGFGRAWMPWIHHADIVGLMDHALRTPSLDGPMNAVAPEPARNRDFMRELGRVLRRPAFMPVPPFMLRVVLGEFGRYAAMSQRVQPVRATETGYAFRHPALPAALSSLYRRDDDPGGGDGSPGTDGAPDGPRDSVVVGRAAADGSTRASAADGPAGRVSTNGHGAGPASDASATAPAACGTDGGLARPIRLVAIPVESGLLVDGRVAAGAAAACRAVLASGGRVVLASGRPPRAVRPVAEAIGLRGAIVTCHGALVWNVAPGTVAHHQPIAPEVAAAVVAAVRAAAPEAMVSVGRLDAWFTDRVEAGASDGRVELHPDGVGPLDDFLTEPVTQLEVLGAPEDSDAIRAALQPFVSDRRIARFEHAGGLFQIGHPAADKSTAVQRIARGAGIDRSEVMAIGGGVHDAGMVEWAGLGVALGDAPDSVRALATVTTEPRDQGGIARALTRYVLAGTATSTPAGEAERPQPDSAAGTEQGPGAAAGAPPPRATVDPGSPAT